MPQKYGPKRNSTRRKRGFPRRDKGKHHRHSEEYKQKVMKRRIAAKKEHERLKAEAWVEAKAAIPKSDKVLKNYIFMFNWYHRVYEWYRNKKVAMDNTKNKFGVTEQTIIRALRVVRFYKYKYNLP